MYRSLSTLSEQLLSINQSILLVEPVHVQKKTEMRHSHWHCEILANFVYDLSNSVTAWDLERLLDDFVKFYITPVESAVWFYFLYIKPNWQLSLYTGRRNLIAFVAKCRAYCCREKADRRERHNNNKKPILTTRMPIMTNMKRFYSDWWQLHWSSPSQQQHDLY